MEEVRNWLRSFGLLQYDTKLEEDGWDSLHDLFDIDEGDLERCIPKAGHRRRFFLAVDESRNGETTTSVRIADRETADSDDERIFIIHPKTKYVEFWLERYGLGRYISKFKEEGWDIPQVLAYMTDENVEACIEKPGHRMKFRLALKNGNLDYIGPLISIGSTDFTENLNIIEDWLKSKSLEDYITKFEDDGWDTLDVLLEIGKEDLRKCINKPGHIKRFQKAVAAEKSRKTCKDIPEGAEKETTKDDWPIREAAVDASSASNTEQKHPVAPPRKQVIAFSATLSESVTGINVGQNIVFDRVILNLGHAYSTGNGVFTAPVPGVYVFSANLDATVKSDTTIARNGQSLVYLQCEPWKPASQTTVVRLSSGDVISVGPVGHNNVAFYGRAFCSFSGFLLHD